MQLARAGGEAEPLCGLAYGGCRGGGGAHGSAAPAVGQQPLDLVEGGRGEVGDGGGGDAAERVRDGDVGQVGEAAALGLVLDEVAEGVGADGDGGDAAGFERD